MSDETDNTSDALTTVTDIVSYAAGVKVPTVVRRSVFKAIGALITGIADVPSAWLESKAQAIRDETAARSFVTAAAAKASAKAFVADEAHVERATNYLGARLLREQKNREKVTTLTVQQLEAEPPSEDAPEEVDDDWLNMFARIAETRTNADMQVYFARLLAGEIRKPGSFSPGTMEVLARLTPDVAKAFQEFCCLSMTFDSEPEMPRVLSEPFGNAGQNALEPCGFNYLRLCRLQEAGLVLPDFTAGFTADPRIFTTSLHIAGRPFRFGPTPKEPSNSIRVSALYFSRAGIELRGIVHMAPNETYIKRFVEWLRTDIKVLDGAEDA